MLVHSDSADAVGNKQSSELFVMVVNFAPWMPRACIWLNRRNAAASLARRASASSPCGMLSNVPSFSRSFYKNPAVTTTTYLCAAILVVALVATDAVASRC